MTTINSVYIAWQAPDTRDWHVVGNLQESKSGYTFKYTKGALASPKFTPFSGMNDFNETYVSEELFPLFKNRLLSPKRPEYPKFIEWLGLNGESVNPIEILSRSGGLRSTDQLQVFKKIDVGADGSFEHYFFLHGLSYLNDMANERVSKLAKGEILHLCLDLQNDHDSQAVVIRAHKPAEIVGYCPRYFANDITKMLLNDSKSVHLTVEKFSDDAPHHYRLLCKLTGNIPKPLIDDLHSQDEFQVIG